MKVCCRLYVMSGFSGKVAIISGSSSGIGAATAVLLAKGGCAVSLTGRNEERLKQVQADCITAGLTSDKINNAGGPTIEGQLSSAVDQPMESFDYVMNLNLRSAVSLTKRCLPQLKETKGVIINVSSIAAVKTLPYRTYYCVAKAALDHFTRCLAAEVGHKGIRVNSVNPGLVRTNILYRCGRSEADVQKLIDHFLPQYPIGRIGDVDDVARLIVYLVSNDASFTTGQTHIVDGGCTIAH